MELNFVDWGEMMESTIKINKTKNKQMRINVSHGEKQMTVFCTEKNIGRTAWGIVHKFYVESRLK